MESAESHTTEVVDETKGLYKIHSALGELTGVYPTEEFSWRTNTQYWVEEQIENALFPKPTLSLNLVWWFNPSTLVTDLKPLRYHVYIRDGLKADSFLPSTTDVIFQTKRLIFITKGTF